MKKLIILSLTLSLATGSVFSTETEDQPAQIESCGSVLKKNETNAGHRLHGIAGSGVLFGGVLTLSSVGIGVPLLAGGLVYGMIQKNQIKTMKFLKVAQMILDGDSALSQIPLGESIADVEAAEKEGIKVYGKTIRRFLKVKAAYSEKVTTGELTNEAFAQIVVDSDTEAGLNAGKNPFCKSKVTKKGKRKVRFKGFSVKRMVKALTNAIEEVDANDEVESNDENDSDDEIIKGSEDDATLAQEMADNTELIEVEDN
jgi:hypothetical protein